MGMPVDIKAVMEAMTDADEARNQSVRVHVYLDDDAPRDLMNIAMAATRSVSDNAQVVYDAYLPSHGIPDVSADLALLVAHDGARTGALYHDLQGVGVPTVVFAVDAVALCEQAKAAGSAIAPEDVVAARSASDQGALKDHADNSPITLDSTDAKAMMDEFGRWVVEVFKEKRLAFAYAFPCVRRPLALESVNATSVQNAGIGFIVLIPGADLPLMTLNQVKMMLEIAGAYGEELSLSRLKEIAMVVGGAFAFRGAARQLVGIVPGVGWVVKGGIGYAGTQALGRALLEYFEDGADFAATAQGMAQKLRGMPTWLGVSRDKGVGENARLVANAAKDTAAKAANTVTGSIVPTISSVVGTVGDVTGLSKDDLTSMAGKAVSSVKSKFTR